ncbi:uncharacterized protein LOC132902834 [Amyelois transitella]|uniref:uncharacterized protein LOC132902834 n=1 Tax=Amyelois transitella TaxID=680683 RepID=UPI00298FC2BC|nr:uncharacterized protein LOC132902834 [Amyelois transitella]
MCCRKKKRSKRPASITRRVAEVEYKRIKPAGKRRSDSQGISIENAAEVYFCTLHSNFSPECHKPNAPPLTPIVTIQPIINFVGNFDQDELPYENQQTEQSKFVYKICTGVQYCPTESKHKIDSVDKFSTFAQSRVIPLKPITLQQKIKNVKKPFFTKLFFCFVKNEQRRTRSENATRKSSSKGKHITNCVGERILNYSKSEEKVHDKCQHTRNVNSGHSFEIVSQLLTKSVSISKMSCDNISPELEQGRSRLSKRETSFFHLIINALKNKTVRRKREKCKGDKKNKVIVLHLPKKDSSFSVGTVGSAAAACSKLENIQKPLVIKDEEPLVSEDDPPDVPERVDSIRHNKICGPGEIIIRRHL